MQLEGLSQLHKQKSPSSSHVYYVPASGGPPALSTKAAAAPTPPAEDFPEELRKPIKKSVSKDDSNLDPLESKVLDEVRKAVSEPRPTLLRRHTWQGDMRDLKKAAGLQRTAEEDQQRRLAELMLPGLKRELYNANSEEKGHVMDEIAEVQHMLGEDVPPARTFMVSRKCDQIEEDVQPTFARSVSW